MKKLFALLVCVLLVFALASCGDDPCSHRDADDNSLCDECGESYTDGKDVDDSTPCSHKDADDNSLCDKCGESYSDGKDGNNNTTTDVNSITLNKNVVNIEVGDSESLTVSFNPENATDKNITWISSDSSIALVNNGIVVGAKVGTTTVIAMTANGKTATCLVNVSPKTYYAESVTLNKTSVDLPIGQNDTLTATVLPDYTTDKSVTWVSSAPSIVKVENGVITALSAGTATVTATTSNGKTASCTVSALFIPVTDIIINESLIYVDAGDLITVNATAVPENATLTNLVWSSSNTNIATVSGGVINGVSDGIAVITVKTADGTIEKSFNVVVENSAGILYTKSGSGYAVSGLAQATETVIIPDTYKGKPVISLSSGIFDSSAYVIKKLYIGKNVTNIPLGCLRNCTALEELSVCNYDSGHYGKLFGTVGISWEGGANDFLPLETVAGSLTGVGGVIYQIPAPYTAWALNDYYLDGWFTLNGTEVYVPDLTIPYSNVVSWQRTTNGIEYYNVPLKVNFTAYYIPVSLTKVYINDNVKNYVESSAETTCIDNVANLKICLEDTVTDAALINYISLDDKEKLMSLGTYELTVYYGGYITTVKVTVTECTGAAAVQENYKDSTCTQTGSYDSVVYCSVCDSELSRDTVTVNAKGHDYVNHDGKAVTCLNIGWDAYQTCSRCDYTSYEEISALGHDYVNHTPKKATCTSIGWHEYDTCSRCNYSTYAEIAKLGHDYVHHNAKAKTCTDIGWKAYDTCSRCDYTSYVEIPASHNPKSAVTEYKVDSKCNEEGSYQSVVYCNDCNKELSRTNNTILRSHKMSGGICTVCGLQQSSSGLKFTLNSDGKGYTLTGIGSCTSNNIVIGVYNNLSVTSIGNSAFRSCSSLTSVVIGNSVTTIGDFTFYECTSLTSVVIGNSVTSIGTDAFSGCYKLVEVINKSSLNITKGSSSYGSLGYALEIHSGESKIVNVDDYLFITSGGINYLIAYVGNETDLTLPESYGGEKYQIYKYAFLFCDSLTSVAIGNGVTSIGDCAFAYCSKLTGVTIPDSVTSIGDGAFLCCDSLTSVAIGNGVTSIGSQAFYYCYKLTGVTIPDSVTSIGDGAFLCCDSLTSVAIGNGVTSIGSQAFAHCYKLTGVTIPDSVTSIGSSAFFGCTSLTNIKYCGTSSQWNAISKGSDWNYSTGRYTITYNYTGN